MSEIIINNATVENTIKTTSRKPSTDFSCITAAIRLEPTKTLLKKHDYSRIKTAFTLIKYRSSSENNRACHLQVYLNHKLTLKKTVVSRPLETIPSKILLTHHYCCQRPHFNLEYYLIASCHLEGYTQVVFMLTPL